MLEIPLCLRTGLAYHLSGSFIVRASYGKKEIRRIQLSSSLPASSVACLPARSPSANRGLPGQGGSGPSSSGLLQGRPRDPWRLKLEEVDEALGMAMARFRRCPVGGRRWTDWENETARISCPWRCPRGRGSPSRARLVGHLLFSMMGGTCCNHSQLHTIRYAIESCHGQNGEPWSGGYRIPTR